MGLSLPNALADELVHESECRSCKATIVWAFMDRTNKRNPLDRRPDPDGRLVVIAWEATGRGISPVVRYLRDSEIDEHEGARYTSHFATCPNAKQHRHHP